MADADHLPDHEWLAIADVFDTLQFRMFAIKNMQLSSIQYDNMVSMEQNSPMQRVKVLKAWYIGTLDQRPKTKSDLLKFLDMAKRDLAMDTGADLSKLVGLTDPSLSRSQAMRDDNFNSFGGVTKQGVQCSESSSQQNNLAEQLAAAKRRIKDLEERSQQIEEQRKELDERRRQIEEGEIRLRTERQQLANDRSRLEEEKRTLELEKQRVNQQF